MTIECVESTDPSNTGQATATDNCDAAPGITFTNSVVAGACPEESGITRSWTATDACGNSVSLDQIISVVDTAPPTITLNGPGSLILESWLDPYVEQGATAGDACDAEPITVVIGGDTVDNTIVGTYVVTYNAVDACGNPAAEVTRTVEVVDTIPPTFTSLPADITVECEGPGGVAKTNSQIDAFLNAPVASDACDPNVAVTNDAPDTFPIGETTVTWEARDNVGNAVTASRVVSVVDTTPPDASCPAGVTVQADSGCLATIPDVTPGVIASDTCSEMAVLTVTQDPPSGTLVGLGTHTITATISDEAGNSTQCTTTATAVDDTPPGLSVPPAVTAECDESTDPSNTGQATASDNCDPPPSVTFTDSVVAASCPQLSVITRQWTATDAAGLATSEDQVITVVDTTAPALVCPDDIALSGGFGGMVVTFEPWAADACDPNPLVTTDVPSGSFFQTGVTTVTATAASSCANTSAPCNFDVVVSCLGANNVKIGTKDARCKGISFLEATSMNETEQLVGMYVPEEGHDKLPANTVVDDGVNDPQTIHTSCSQPIGIGGVFGAYTITDLGKIYDDDHHDRGNEVEIRGSFDPAVPFDLAVDDVTYSISDQSGHEFSLTIPAGSFQVDGNPDKQKFKFHDEIDGMDVNAKFEKCKFKIKVKGVMDTSQFVGTTMTIHLEVGANVGAEAIEMEDKHNHLKFKRHPKANCCPKCKGIASMQVTSDQGVLTFEPEPGHDKLPSNTTVDDGVNGPVTIHTSCSQPIEVGDVFGAYTVSELDKIFKGEEDAD